AHRDRRGRRRFPGYSRRVDRPGADQPCLGRSPLKLETILTTETQPLDQRISLVGRDIAALRSWAADRNLPAFRAAQVHHGLYRRLAVSPSELTDLPL